MDMDVGKGKEKRAVTMDASSVSWIVIACCCISFSFGFLWGWGKRRRRRHKGGISFFSYFPRIVVVAAVVYGVFDLHRRWMLGCSTAFGDISLPQVHW